MNNMILPLQLIINGNKNYYSIGDYISNFNLRKNESLYLYNNFTNMLKDSIHDLKKLSLVTETHIKQWI